MMPRGNPSLTPPGTIRSPLLLCIPREIIIRMLEVCCSHAYMLVHVQESFHCECALDKLVMFFQLAHCESAAALLLLRHVGSQAVSVHHNIGMHAVHATSLVTHADQLHLNLLDTTTSRGICKGCCAVAINEQCLHASCCCFHCM